MIKVFAGKVRKTGFFQKAGFPGNSDRFFGICYMSPLTQAGGSVATHFVEPARLHQPAGHLSWI
jgi:hypothetical protein